MNQEVKTKAIKFGISFSLLLLVITIVGVVSFGWFSMNRNVTASGMVLKTKDPKEVAVANYQIYRRDGAENIAKLIYDSEDTENEGKEREDLVFEMTEYDTVFIDRNVDTPIVLRVALQDLRRDTTNAFESLSISIKCPDGHMTRNADGKDVMSEYMSNIISIQCAAIHELDIYTKLQAQNIYEGVRDAFSDATVYPSKSFLTIGTGKVLYKETMITFDLSDFTLTNDLLYVYFEFSYNTQNVTRYIGDHEIEMTVTDDGELSDLIQFDFDLEELIFNYE